ncbi:MAG: hypothetical protein K0U13_01780 [Chlamydiae bacterium]|nr:hypothetical protein [Chlamydiota bacterium]
MEQILAASFQEQAGVRLAVISQRKLQKSEHIILCRYYWGEIATGIGSLPKTLVGIKYEIAASFYNQPDSVTTGFFDLAHGWVIPITDVAGGGDVVDSLIFEAAHKWALFLK